MDVDVDITPAAAIAVTPDEPEFAVATSETEILVRTDDGVEVLVSVAADQVQVSAEEVEVEVALTDTVVHVAVIGDRGPRGEPGLGAGPAYIHTQAAPDSIWAVIHNLGRNPFVHVIVGSQDVEVTVLYCDENSLQVQFASPQVGIANCY